MSSSPAIRAFLGGVRRRLRRRALARAGLYLASASIVLAASAPLAAFALTGQGRNVAWVAGVAALAALVAAAAIVLVPGRRWRTDHAVAA
ncbi:MAG TPA: hypothetical protein VEL05_02900, partial [Candidatus Acidoferrum sp.]|nr:hypothetical protein [Candidatus Acidoferrum sp.]